MVTTIIWTVIGGGIVVAVLADVFLTILSTSRAGPLTTAWSHAVWKPLLRLHQRRGIHSILSMTGPAIVVLTILFWYTGLVVGTWVVLLAHPGSVVSSTTRAPADTVETFYFVPTTLSGLGYGDYVPVGSPWTAFATTMTLLTTVVLTLSLSYVISVLSAAISTRSMASGIRALGDDPVALVRNADVNDPQASMSVYLASMASTVSDVAERQLAYPVLRYFHSTRPQTAMAPAVLLLSDATFLLTHAPPRLRAGAGLRAVLDAAIDDVVAVKRTPRRAGNNDGMDDLRRQGAELGIDTAAGSSFDDALPDYLTRRSALLAACQDDGWGEPAHG